MNGQMKMKIRMRIIMSITLMSITVLLWLSNRQITRKTAAEITFPHGHRNHLRRNPIDEESLAHLFATKTTYWNQNNHQEMNTTMRIHAITQWNIRNQLELVQTQVVTRHGTRFPTADNMLEIQAFLHKLEPFQRRLPAWLQSYRLPYNLSVEAALASRGVQEMQAYGDRLLQQTTRSSMDLTPTHHKKRFHNATYRIQHSAKARTRDSAHAFVSSYFENPADVKYHEIPSDLDILLRFYDHCPRYQHRVKQNASALREYHEFLEDSTYMNANRQHLQQTLQLKALNFTASDVMAVYSACAFDIALDYSTTQWCSLLATESLITMDFVEDLKAFYELGGGFAINYEMAAVLLQDIVIQIRQMMKNQNSLQGIFRFAHAETTLPLMTLLGYGSRDPLAASVSMNEIKRRGFKTSSLAPFAANLEFRLYRKAEQHFVQIRINEQDDRPIPGCGGQVYCEWSRLEKLWERYLALDFASYCAVN